MPQITAIKPQKRKDYFNLFVDDSFVCGLTGQVIIDEKLKVGQQITQQDINRLVNEHEVNKLLDKALNWLSFRPRSSRELAEYLRKPKGKFRETGSEQAQQIVMQRILDKGYVDDREFARWWIENRTRFRPRSQRLLLLELQKKGINRDVAEQVFDELRPTSVDIGNSDSESAIQDDESLALEIAQKNLRKYQKYEPREAKNKLAAFLARRGFSWDVIKPVIDQVVKNE